MPLEERLEQLENAHRALGARHEGLMMVCRVMLPFIALPQDGKERLMQVAYDSLSAHLESTGCDAEFQQDAKQAIDELFGTILA